MEEDPLAIFDGTKYTPHIAAEPASPRRPPYRLYDFAEL